LPTAPVYILIKRPAFFMAIMTRTGARFFYSFNRREYFKRRRFGALTSLLTYPATQKQTILERDKESA
jgi:hypothetical protein